MDRTRLGELIELNLPFYRDLDTGLREPTTPDQRRFVKVCRGELQAQSEHERAYMAYCQGALSKDGDGPQKTDYIDHLNRIGPTVNTSGPFQKRMPKPRNSSPKSARKSELQRKIAENRAKSKALRKEAAQKKYANLIRSGQIKGKQSMGAPKKSDWETSSPYVSSGGKPGGTKPVQEPAGRRYIAEPLGSRDDFKKDSASNRNRAMKPK
jgi:hypothetical protein